MELSVGNLVDKGEMSKEKKKRSAKGAGDVCWWSKERWWHEEVEGRVAAAMGGASRGGRGRKKKKENKIKKEREREREREGKSKK